MQAATLSAAEAAAKQLKADCRQLRKSLTKAQNSSAATHLKVAGYASGAPRVLFSFLLPSSVPAELAGCPAGSSLLLAACSVLLAAARWQPKMQFNTKMVPCRRGSSQKQKQQGSSSRLSASSSESPWWRPRVNLPLRASSWTAR
jgi:uncharacterized membrane protein YgcG